MCGICGFVGASDDGLIERMRDTLAHRGPDESGSYSDGRVHFGHRRLSVIDLGMGQQPFASADGKLVLVFNGEIYNYPALRVALEQRGHVFRTRCDTESIVHAYREYGARCPEHLDGMFAFVLYDREKQILFGARDRFGKKPLFYSTPLDGGSRRFVFASETRSLLEDPSVRRSAGLSVDGVVAYLLHDYIPGSSTAFENIHRMPAGSSFTIRLDEAVPASPEFRRFWRNPILDRPEPLDGEKNAIAEIDRLLDAAVQRRLMADVPLGVFLSGGIDSSAIVAFLARHTDPAAIQTFAIGFDDASFDESEFAALAARHFGTRHRSRIFTAEHCIAELDHCIRHMDEPFADPSILPTSLLSRFAREHVTVALTGDGGDELFAGYDPFRAIRPARLYDAVVPGWLHPHIGNLAQTIFRSDGANMSPGFRIERFLRGAKAPAAERLTTWMGAFDAKGAARLLGATSATEVSRRYLAQERALVADNAALGSDPVQAALAYFQTCYLVDDILVKADRASMMHSLELRSPFLDTSLAGFANRLPGSVKYRRGTTKYILKQVLARGRPGSPMIPDRLLRRPKKGFGIPISRWIRRELRDRFRASLVDDWPKSLGFLDASRIKSLLDRHIDGGKDFGKELWALFMLRGWVREWIG